MDRPGRERRIGMGKHKNLLIWILERLGIITRIDVSKEDMCRQAQNVCNHNCEGCAWHTNGTGNESVLYFDDFVNEDTKGE